MKKIIIILSLIICSGQGLVQAVNNHLPERQEMMLRQIETERIQPFDKPAPKLNFFQKKIIKFAEKRLAKKASDRKKRKRRTYGARSLIFLGWGLLLSFTFLGIGMYITAFIFALKGLVHDENPHKAIIGLVLSAVFIIALVIGIIALGFFLYT